MCAWTTAIIGDNHRGINSFHLHFADKGCTEYIRRKDSDTEFHRATPCEIPFQVQIKKRNGEKCYQRLGDSEVTSKRLQLEVAPVV